MSFQLEWTDDAEQELTRIWLRSRFRSRITEVASFVERELRRRPEENQRSIGESRDLQRRIILQDPLGFIVEVDQIRRSVVVLTVWETPDR